ncbi:hypothetical protein [Yersinia ruckeri]|uniref:hypothetical protein n=1 Tax=Yersinia ruckeri TaxID=29486 RepID=UPI002238253F|nr:hypothetical protein [Yersinia ruckeri]MCW6598692.1 hypothetical protein [Yersinia ruckeri]
MSDSTPYLNRINGQLVLANRVLNHKAIIYANDTSEEELQELLDKGFLIQLDSAANVEVAPAIISEGLDSLNVSLPSGLYRIKSAMINDTIYLMGGYTYPGNDHNESILRFNGNTLFNIADTLISREDGALFLQDEKSAFLTSYSPDDYLGQSSQKINLQSGAITTNKLANPLLKFFSSCEDDQYIYLIGGINPDETNNVKVYRLDKASPTEFEVIGTLKDIRSLSACCLYKNSIYIIGGVQIQNGVYQGVNSIEVFNLDLRESEVLDIRIPNDLGFYAYFNANLKDGRMLVAGGCFNESQYSTAIYEFSLDYLIWRSRTSELPAPIAYGTCQIIGESAYFIGGLCQTNPAYRNILRYTFTNLPIPDPNLKATQLSVRHNSNNLSRRLITFDAFLFMSNGDIKTVGNSYDISWEFTSTEKLKFSLPTKAKNIVEVDGEGAITAIATINGVKSKPVTVDIYDIKAIEIYGEDSIILGSMREYKALARYSNGALEDLNEDYYWQISNRSILIFNGNLVTAVATGKFSLTAKFEAFAATKEVEIYDRYSELETVITDPRPTYRVGQTIQVDVLALSTSNVKKSIMGEEGVTIDILSKDQIQKLDNIPGRYSLVRAGNGSVISRWEELNSYINIVIEEEILDLRLQAPIRISKGDRFVVSVFVTLPTQGIVQITDMSRLTFASDNPAVLSINALGQIVGEGFGEAAISVLFEDKQVSTIIIVE